MDQEVELPSKEDYEPHLGSVFSLEWDGGVLELKLHEIKDQADLASKDAHGNLVGNPSPFSLAFSAPKNVFLEQAIYLLKHPEMGELHLFMVPYHEEEEEYFYSVAFN